MKWSWSEIALFATYFTYSFPNAADFYIYIFLCIDITLSVQHDNPFCKSLLKLTWQSSSKHLAKSRSASVSFKGSPIAVINYLNDNFPLTHCTIWGIIWPYIVRHHVLCYWGMLSQSVSVFHELYLFFWPITMGIFNSGILTNCLMVDILNLLCCIASDE